VEVTGRSGAGVPELRPADSDAQGGRGLQLVAGTAARLGLAGAWRADGDLVLAIARLASPPDGNTCLSIASASVAALVRCDRPLAVTTSDRPPVLRRLSGKQNDSARLTAVPGMWAAASRSPG